MSPHHVHRVLALVAILATTLNACGDNGEDGSSGLSAAAGEGRSVFRAKQCASCHGANGQGQVGPSLVGLVGSDVMLDDGTTVAADRDYLVESILEPSAKIVDGYPLPMTRAELDDGELDAIIAYIEALTPVDGDA